MQNKEDIKKWLILRLKKSSVTFEPTDIEFKKAEDISVPLLKTVSSFSNTEGGWIILGIHEKDGKIKYIGIEKAQAMENKIISKLEKEFSLNLISHAMISVVDFEERKDPLIFIQINKITNPLNRPCYIKSCGELNGSFVRRGQNDKRMPSEMIDELIRDKERIKGSLPPAELTPINRADIEDLDLGKIKELLEDLKIVKPPKLIEDSIEYLKNNGFISGDNKPTLLGILWFAKNPALFIESRASVYCKMENENLEEPLLDKEMIEGTVLELIEKAREYVRKKMNTKRVVKENGSSYDIPDYPDDVVKEIIVNAIAHRDYDNANTPVTVTVFKNRLEIINPGTLNSNIYNNSYIFPANSEPRNRSIFKFLLAYQAEHKGKGFTTLLKRCLEGKIDFPYLDISHSERVKVVIPKGELLDESVENWLNFKRHFFEKKGFTRLDRRFKTILAYFYKRDQRVKEGKFVINITKDTNFLNQLSKLEDASLIIPRQVASSIVYFLNENLQEKTFEDELRKIFGSSWDKLKAENKKILNMIYEFNGNNNAPLPARQIAQILYPNYVNDEEFHDKYYGKIKRLCLTMEKYGFINRKDPASSPRGGYWINKKFKQITENLKSPTEPPTLFD